MTSGGHNIPATKKFRDAERDARVAFVVDDVLPPWQPRAVEVRGRAEVSQTGGAQIGPGFGPEVIRVTPTRVISWGLDTDAYHSSSRAVNK
ncbi:MAG: hypothetical protein ACR2M0_14385 [Chloroflexia bacterium]